MHAFLRNPWRHVGDVAAFLGFAAFFATVISHG